MQVPSKQIYLFFASETGSPTYRHYAIVIQEPVLLLKENQWELCLYQDCLNLNLVTIQHRPPDPNLPGPAPENLSFHEAESLRAFIMSTELERSLNGKIGLQMLFFQSNIQGYQ